MLLCLINNLKRKKRKSKLSLFLYFAGEIIVGLFTLNFSKIGSGVRSALGGVKDIFSSIFKGIINFAIDKINFFIRKLNSAISFAKNNPGLSSLVGELHISTIPKLAGGGLVVPGQLFIAREAGPELVGTIGGHTAVMNNNQIVEAVSNGVYRTVTMAMGSMGLLSSVSFTAFLLSEKKSCKRKPTLAEGLRRITSLRFAARLLGVAFAPCGDRQPQNKNTLFVCLKH